MSSGTKESVAAAGKEKAASSKKSAGSRRARLADIARECGVSVSTVSRALSGEKGVREDIRRKVIDAASAARYAVPAGLAGNRILVAASGAAMIDYERHQFTLHVLEGLRARAEALGLDPVTRPLSAPGSENNVLAEARDDARVGGLLLLSVDDEDVLSAAATLPKAVVMVNGEDPFMRLSSVTPCNRSAARLAADHLVACGHSRILFMMRPGRRTIERRQEGWRDALRDAGLPHGDDLVLNVEDWRTDLAAATLERRIANHGLNFTAILTAADSLAVGALEALRRLNLRVPEDVAVMGMDDLPQAAFLEPPLTTVHIPMREIGAAALDLLADEMARRDRPSRRVEIACPLVLRASTAMTRAR